LAILNAYAIGISTSTSGGGSAIGTADPANGDSGMSVLSLSGNVTLVCDSLRASAISVRNALVLAFTAGDRLFRASRSFSGGSLVEHSVRNCDGNDGRLVGN
jgi:hypothetical protein